MKPLPFGTFVCERRRGVDLDGFSLAEFVDRPEGTVARHTHEDAHFWFVLKGRYVTSARGVDPVCGPPTVIFNPAGTTHRDRFHSRRGRFLALSVAPALIDRIGGHRVLAEQAVGFTSGELPWLAGRLYGELQHADAVSPIVLEGLGLEVLASAVREGTRRTTRGQPWLQAAFELVNDCYLQRLTVKGIAQAVGVPPLLLGRSFRRAFGCSPGEMVRRRRVARAEALLRRGLPLAEVALASGFADQAQLTKAFRRITGFTPGRYRTLLSA